MNFVDPNEFCLTGQNPFMCLFEGEEEKPRTTASLWRVDLSPAGPGHALFVLGDITNGTSRLFTDNIALARYIQEDIYVNNKGIFSHFSDPALDPVEASFHRRGDLRSFVVEEVVSRVHHLTLTWFDFLSPFKAGTAPKPEAGKRLAHYALYVPARRVRLEMDGKVAKGAPRIWDRNGREDRSCAVALAETWVRPTTS